VFSIDCALNKNKIYLGNEIYTYVKFHKLYFDIVDSYQIKNDAIILKYTSILSILYYIIYNFFFSKELYLFNKSNF